MPVRRWYEALRLYVAPLRRLLGTINSNVGQSTFGRIFRLEGCGHPKAIRNSNFLTEIRAGVTTFLTMAYILSVNAAMIGDTGGNCVCTLPNSADVTCSRDPEYKACVTDQYRDLITATAAICGLSSVLFGLLTNLPVALGPGMSLSAYFAYEVVGYHGTGHLPYGLALAAVFIEGLIFILLSLLGLRQWLVRLVPNSLKIAAACGIGLFLALVGLSYSVGIGVISTSSVRPLAIAGCPPQYLNEQGACASHKMQNPTMWLGIFCGGVVTVYLMAYGTQSAIVIGIALVTIISWPRNTPVTYFPYTEEGNARFEFFKHGFEFHPIHHTLGVFNWDVGKAPAQFVLALFTFLYIGVIECTATLYSIARFAELTDGNGDFPRSTLAYCINALCITLGAVFGVSPVTVFMESAAGVAQGGRTGLTGVTTGVCFLLSIFCSPIFASIPPWATGCALIIIGCIMSRQIMYINWHYIGDAIPAFVTLVVIPFSFSTAYGLIAGLLVYVCLNTLIRVTTWVTKRRILPESEDLSEDWSWKPVGNRPWFMRASRIIAMHLAGRRERVGSTEIDGDTVVQSFVGSSIPMSDLGSRPSARRSGKAAERNGEELFA